ncbi:hypothetical protein HPB52_017966 [Rhipicephalus sanguineus]|uniref:Uncharacterized protein n=1 Tax=Rhipicephalus sanguineus TaxID=34632 RepID=A0A9D4TB89_RHISA|nr:hypothetical protein HPB52_017966 [Rhipicephalus sanguineus]
MSLVVRNGSTLWQKKEPKKPMLCFVHFSPSDHVHNPAFWGSRRAQKWSPLPISCAVQSFPPQVSLQEQTSVLVDDSYKDTAEDDESAAPWKYTQS